MLQSPQRCRALSLAGETLGQRCKGHNASRGKIDLELVSLEQDSSNERRALYTQDADALHLSLPVDVSRVEIENALAGVSKRAYPRRRRLEREGVTVESGRERAPL